VRFLVDAQLPPGLARWLGEQGLSATAVRVHVLLRDERRAREHPAVIRDAGRRRQRREHLSTTVYCPRSGRRAVHGRMPLGARRRVPLAARLDRRQNVPDLFAPSLVVEPKVGAGLSKMQKRFNGLVREIERLKAEAVEWRDAVPREIARIRHEHQPFFDAYRALRIELVTSLDRAASERRMTKTERVKLRRLIPAITAELLAEQPDEPLEALHDKYSDVSLDEQSSIMNEALKSVVGHLYGVEISEGVDMTDPEHLDRLARKIEVVEEQQREQERRRAAEARRAKRGASARAAGAAAARQAAAAQIKKSLQDIYRKLASALHPDRTSDETERRRRTGLMQRVNVAYGSKDLLQLLELQLEIEQIDGERIGALPETQLEHYVSILEEQRGELLRAIEEAQSPIRLELDLSPFSRLSAKWVIAEARRDMQDLKHAVAALRHDVSLLRSGSSLKAWLREYSLPEDDHDGFVVDELDILDAVRKRGRR
jgi:hypothetical protein